MADVAYGGPATPTTNDKMSLDKLKNKLEDLKRSRSALDRTWKINLSFYKGQQWVFFNPTTQIVESLPTLEGEKPRYRVRITNNHVLRGATKLLALVTKTKPILHATPSSQDASAVRSAKLAEQLVEFWWDNFKLKDKLDEAMLWGIIAGQGYWKITWDGNAGDPMEVVLNPTDGSIVTDPQMKQLFIEEAINMGIDLKVIQKKINMGDIKVQVLSPFEVYLDPNASLLKDAKYGFCIHGMTPEEIQAQFGGELLSPDSMPINFEAINSYRTTGKTAQTLVMVNFGYFPPSGNDPKGRYVVWTDKGNAPLYDGPWPFPFQHLPLIKFPGVRVPGQIYDSSVVEHVIPLQKDYNKTLSSIIEVKNLTVKPQYMAPKGSLRVRLTNEPGAVFHYQPINGMKPEPMQMPQIPQYVFPLLDNLRASIDDLFMIPRVQQGDVPPNVEAGIAIDLLQETATDGLAPMVMMMEEALADAGQMLLSMAREYYTDPRLAQVAGNGGKGQIKFFRGSDIDSGITIKCETGSGLPRTRAGRQARIMELLHQGVIDIRQGWKFFEAADLRSLGAQFEADEALAWREYDLINAGQPVNMTAARDAQKMIASPGAINPTTGQPFQAKEEVIDYLRSESLQPHIYEDFDTHLTQHALQLKAVEFMSLPTQVQDDLVMHYNQTLAKKNEISLYMKHISSDNTRINYQVKGTAGPTTASKIYDAVGIQTSPQELSEPPLLTWESDSMDIANPEGEEAGNVEELRVRQIHEMQQLQQAQQMAMQEEQQKMAADQQQHSQAMDILKMHHEHNKLQVAQQQAHANAQAKQKAKADSGNGPGKA